jgi:hypothetical protein
MSNAPPDDREDEIRELIGAVDSATSRAHDDAVLAAARASADGPRPQARGGRLRRFIPFGLAAAFALIAVGLLQRQPQPDDDTLRSTAAGLEQLVTPVNGATLTSIPAELRWPAQNGASNYRVTLRDSSATVIWRSATLPEPRVAFDAATRERLTPQVYYWSVDAEGAAPTRKLGPFWFRLQ